MAAADRVARNHRDDRFRAPADLDLKVEHVEPTDATLGHGVVAKPWRCRQAAGVKATIKP